MKRKTSVQVLWFIFLLFFCYDIYGQEIASVGIKEAPPFAFRDAKGDWVGITVDLWKEINPNYDNKGFYEMSLEELLKSVEKGEILTGLGAISITDSRERVIDFSIPYFETGLAIATRKENTDSVNNYLVTLGKVLKALLPWIILLFIVGILIWLIEKKSNDEEFQKQLGKGISSGIWWACVTMTTVGYGDKTPKSFLGRILGVFWMFSGIILISSLTATITSSMTLDRLDARVESIEDLKNKNVGIVQSTSSEEYLIGKGITSNKFETLEIALTALQDKKINFLIHDKPIMKYIISKNSFEAIEVLDITLNKELYGFPVQDEAFFLEVLNIGILGAIQSGKLEVLIERYL
jgi:ABC-type amino acid transport substrate-binding protein